MADDTGDVNNDFLGDCHIEGSLPDGAGDSTQWTPSSGNNYQAVDETAPDGDSTYIESETAGHKDLYSHSDLTRITGSIVGVQVNMVGRLTKAATPRTVKAKAKSGTAEGDGANYQYDSTDYRNAIGIFESNPDTTAPWTVTEINSAQFGLELVP